MHQLIVRYEECGIIGERVPEELEREREESSGDAIDNGVNESIPWTDLWFRV